MYLLNHSNRLKTKYFQFTFEISFFTTVRKFVLLLLMFNQDLYMNIQGAKGHTCLT